MSVERRPFDRRVLAVAAVLFAVLMALSTRYGWHRDELYFLACARHLQASYVDQPVLAPLLARASLSLFGLSVTGLRLWPALAAATTVLVGALTAREVGGGRRAQLLAAAVTATMPALWGSAHVANTTSYLVLAWATLALVAARIGGTGDPRWWLAGGAVLGIGLADNHLIGFFALALTVGTLLSGGRRLVFNGWFAAGFAIALAFAVPDVWWQAQHQWAELAMDRQLNHENGGLLHVPTFVLGQLFLVTVTLIGLWLAGLRLLWRAASPAWRGLAWAYGLLFVFFALTTGTKIYYLTGCYVYLVAAGAVAVDGWRSAHPRRAGAIAVATALATALFAALVLPVLPPGRPMDQTLAETVGWPQLVDTVRGVWTALPPDQRASAVIYTADYSEAAAINLLGRAAGLPTAVSAHNTYWWWGPGNPDASTVVAVGPGPSAAPRYAATLGAVFTDVHEVATVTNPYGVHNIESGGHIYVCTGPRQPWSALWRQLRHYD